MTILPIQSASFFRHLVTWQTENDGPLPKGFTRDHAAQPTSNQLPFIRIAPPAAGPPPAPRDHRTLFCLPFRVVVARFQQTPQALGSSDGGEGPHNRRRKKSSHDRGTWTTGGFAIGRGLMFRNLG